MQQGGLWEVIYTLDFPLGEFDIRREKDLRTSTQGKKMAVRKVEGGKWEVTFYWTHPLTSERKRFRKWSPYGTKRESEKWEAEQLVQLQDRNWYTHQKELKKEASKEAIPTLAAFVPVFLDRIGSQVKPGTVIVYRSRLESVVIPVLGGKRLDQITEPDIDLLFEEMKVGGAENAYINGVGVALGSLYSRAVRWQILTKNDRPDINLPGTKSSQGDLVRYFTEEEIEAYFKTCPDKIRNMSEFALRTGMRIGEIQALRWADIDYDRKTISICRTWTISGIGSTKSGSSRVNPITDDLIRFLKEHKQSEFAGVEYVFQIEGEEPATRNQLRSPMDIAIRNAGIEGYRIGFHSFRHTFASRLATRGISLRLLQKLLGHSSIKTTERYAHLLPESTEVARGFLEALKM